MKLSRITFRRLVPLHCSVAFIDVPKAMRYYTPYAPLRRG